jgi:predicted nucleic acid-binding protein
LAAEFDDVLLLLDDLKARKLAAQLMFKTTGTLGIIHKAKQLSFIPKVKPLIDKLLLTNFRISKDVVNEILRLNGE